MRKAEQSTKLDLERIIFIGRTFEEYLDMFSLSIEALRGKKILDCPAGACSFTAVGNKSDLNVTACDIAYDYSGEDLKKKGLRDLEHAMENMEIAKSNYKWDYFKDIEGLKKHRLSALIACTDDMDKFGINYISAALPSLPFKDEQFDLLLSAHFLFMYANRLDYQFHIKTVKEFLRVTKEEIRIFPLVDLEGKRYEHLDQLLATLVDLGCSIEEAKVAYEFQTKANTMLKIRKNKQ
ncbi:SAM-dependent methyltransferase [Neobacillus sp. SM06]|uniref:SAM-dependent methyltransferase n=1 Tax=Neobacillus sp. SM06 TaxID=3422492 RepID=UPI003D265A5E